MCPAMKLITAATCKPGRLMMTCMCLPALQAASKHGLQLAGPGGPKPAAAPMCPNGEAAAVLPNSLSAQLQVSPPAYRC